MAPDDDKTQERLTPEQRSGLLRAFGDRMLLKLTAMDDPEDLPGIERAVRVAAVIERIYSRCDRAEAQAPDPNKLEAERARNARDALQARVSLANSLQWGEDRRKDLGPWWDAADTSAPTQARRPAPVQEDLPVTPADAIAAVATAEVAGAIDTVIHRCAQWAGTWPDGEPYLPGKSGWRKHTLTNDLALPDDDTDPELWLGRETLARANAIARHSGRRKGTWFDGRAYSDQDPDYFQLSANFSTATEHPTDTEQPGPEALPWWIVRKPPP